ncbi:putative aminoacyltransferase, E1 ubiquitin-activating enzyme [Medicago truncatula]|uniref:RING-type E3 ubiquitin transferase n=3 Tax=Medicago truncatula TaxID=3880 RepID=A0A396HRX8_MEDTR|nr:putative aminoacyltransferase, E1 ubiquitin-activating enzyme [Medicago truncatula]
MDVPEDAFRYVVADIFKCARDMVNGVYKNQRDLSIRVVLSVTRASEDETDDDDDDNHEEEDGDEENNGLIPAAKSCIEELEVVKVEKVEECAICLNDVIIGVAMPCLSHTFHMKCIRRWLNRGNSCPLCRIQLPTRTSK